MAVAVAMIYGFEPVPQATTQTFVVPAVPNTTNYEELCVAYPANDDTWRNFHTQATGCYPMDGAYSGGYYAMNPAFNRGTYMTPAYNGRAKYHNDSSRCAPRGMHRNSKTGAPPSFQEPEDKNVTIVLSNLPQMLCSENGFEVALDATRMKDSVRLFAVEKTSNGIEAVVILKSEAAAQTVMKHFRGVSCGRTTGGVTARYCAERGNKLLLPKEDREDKESEETVPSAENSPSSTPKSAPKKTSGLVLTRSNLKMRWADYEDDCDSDYEEDAQSTIAGAVRSCSEGTDLSNPDEL
jgi:hypothetical protein